MRRGDWFGAALTVALVVVLAVVSMRTLWMQLDDFRARVEALEATPPPQPVDPCDRTEESRWH